MEETLNDLYNESIKELESIGIDIKEAGNIDIKISKRNNKRYGCCKQENPEESTKYIEKIGYRRIIKYRKFNTHHIEISPWLMESEKNIIKNTIIHEIIHCLPDCNNHGKIFKTYAKIINQKLGYTITTVGNKQQDYINSNKQYVNKTVNNYKIECEKCGQVFYRQRLNKNLVKKYRCGKCRGRLKVVVL